MKQSDISKLETGRMLQTTGIARLARALGVTDLWLEMNEGPPPAWGRGSYSPDSEGRSLHEPRNPVYSLSEQNSKKRLRLKEWLRAGADGGLTPVTPGEEEVGFIDLDVAYTEGMYAVRIRGDGLSPVYDDGMVLVIAPSEAAGPLSRVLLTMTTGERRCARVVYEKDPQTITFADLVTGRFSTIDRAELAAIELIRSAQDAATWRP